MSTSQDDRPVSGRMVGRKLRRAWNDRTLVTKIRRHVSNSLVVPALSLAGNARLSGGDRKLDLETGFRDHRNSPGELRCSDTALGRLIEAFNASEADADGACPPELRVNGVWAEWLEVHYALLRKLLRSQDIDGLRILLENLHREPMSTGVGGTRDDVSRVPGPLVASYYRSLWVRFRDLLVTVRSDWSDVASPLIGNPQGAWVDGRLVQIDTLEKAYYATVLSSFDDPEPMTILEIGAGMGGQAIQFLRLGGSKVQRYTIIDLPEVACLSGYCLLAALGENRVRLYGEINDQAVVELEPHWQITARGNASADLVFNTYSFSEMDSDASGLYLSAIERICSRWFFHVNHETRFRYRKPDGSTSVNRIGSEMIPDPDLFRLTRHRRREFVRPENRTNLAFEYLYERDPIGV